MSYKNQSTTIDHIRETLICRIRHFKLLKGLWFESYLTNFKTEYVSSNSPNNWVNNGPNLDQYNPKIKQDYQGGLHENRDLSDRSFSIILPRNRTR